MTNMKNPSVISVNEIVGAIMIPHISDDVLNEFKQDPNSYLSANYDLNFECDINLAENTNDVVNIALPYYSELDKMTSHELSSAELTEISGGEIFITIGVVCGVGLAFAGGLAGAATGGTIVAGIAIAGTIGGLAGAAVTAVAAQGVVMATEDRTWDGRKK